MPAGAQSKVKQSAPAVPVPPPPVIGAILPTDSTYQLESDLSERFLELKSRGQYAAALAVADSFIQLRSGMLRTYRLAPEDDLWVAHQQQLMGEVWGRMGDFERADSLFRISITTHDRVLGVKDTTSIGVPMRVMLFYRRWGSQTVADSMLADVLARAERIYGPDDSMLQYIRDEYAMAAPPEQETRFDEVPDDVREARTFYALEKAGYLDAAAALADSVVQRLKAQDRGGTDELREWLEYAARAYAQRGDLETADRLSAEAIRLQLARGDSVAAAGMASLRVAMHSEHGMHARADSLRRVSMALHLRIAGPQSAEYVLELLMASGDARNRGDEARSDSLYRQAADLARRVDPPADGMDGGYFQTMRTILGLLAESRGERGLADTLFASADSAVPGFPSTTLLIRMAGARRQGQHARADSLMPLLEQSLVPAEDVDPEYLEAVGGVGNVLLAIALHEQALHFEETGSVAEAVAVRARAAEIVERDWETAVPRWDASPGPPLPVAEYLAHSTVALNAKHPADTELTRLGATLALRYKGRQQDAVSDLLAWYRDDPLESVLIDSLAALRTTLSVLASSMPAPEDSLRHRTALARAQALHDALEADLGRKAGDPAPPLPVVRLDEVQAAIPDDAVLVELMGYDAARRTFWGEAEPSVPRYAAYILAREGPPRFVDLGDAAALDALVADFTAALADPRRDAREASTRIRDAILRPLRPQIGDARHLLVSPDGMLNLLPFAALTDTAGRYLVESYTITYLSSGRDLVRLAHRPAGVAGPPLVVADPDFRRPAQAARSAADDAGARGGTERRRRAADLGSLSWGPLPGTAKEAEALRDILPGGTFLLGARAAEPLLKRTVGPRVLHVATHGFFLADAPAAGRADSARAGDVLLHAGLALAGANLREGGEGEDGILTALEVSGLDLRGTELVVLSACETGVGQARAGQGVYGLRRALVLAGARAQLTTLWRVDDAATRDAMTEYYERLRQGQGRSEALREVQLGMLVNPGRAHPYFWAAFIPLGDWAPLPPGTLADRSS